MTRNVRQELALAILSASSEECPVWEDGLDEIVNEILSRFEVRPL